MSGVPRPSRQMWGHRCACQYSGRTAAGPSARDGRVCGRCPAGTGPVGWRCGRPCFRRPPRGIGCQLRYGPGAAGDPGPGRGAAAACHAAYSGGIAGLARAAGPAAGLSRLAAVRLADLADTDHCARMALRWEALAADGTVFPALEADLMLTPAGEQVTLLAVAGTYRRQPGWAGAGLDQAIVRGVPRRRSAASWRGSRVRSSTLRGQPVPRVLAHRVGRQGNRSRNRPVTGPVLGGCHPRTPARAEPRSCPVDLGLESVAEAGPAFHPPAGRPDHAVVLSLPVGRAGLRRLIMVAAGEYVVMDLADRLV